MADGPNGRLVFDESGVATDGELYYEGQPVDMREQGLVAVLVGRAVIAPNALATDDAIIRRRLLSGIIWARRAPIVLGWTVSLLAAGGAATIVQRRLAKPSASRRRWSIPKS